jgi:peptide/nickel transport system substrate-binding protein
MAGRRVIAAVVAAVLLATAVSGAALAGSSGTQANRVLRVNISNSDVQYLDPQLDYEFYGWTLLFATCANLMSYPDKGGSAGSRLVPEVSQGFPRVSKDGKTYTFTIRKGFRFNTGQPVTAGSYARAIERVLNKKMASPAAGFIADIVGAEAVQAGKRVRPSGVIAKGNTLTIKLTAPSADLVARLAMRFFCAVPEDLEIDPKGVKLPPMAGPFYFAAREPGRSVTLQRNPYYGGNRTPRVDTIQVTVNTDIQTSLLQVRSGQADLDAAGVPPQSNAQLSKEFGINRGRFFIHTALAVNYIALNTTRGMLKDPRVRQALNYAVDRTIVTNAAGFRAGKPTDQVIPPGIAGYRDASIYPTRANVARAKALLAGRTGKLSLYTSTGPPTEEQALIIQSSLKAVGIDVTVKKYPFGVLLGKIGSPKEPYDMILIGWYADYADPYDFIDVLLNGNRIAPRNNLGNISLFDDPKFNKEMDVAAKLTGDARYAAYASLDERIMRQAAPWVPINNPNVREFVSTRVGCYVYVPAFQLMSLAVACLK